MFIILCAHGPGSVGWNDLLSLLSNRYHFTHLSRGQNGNIIFVNHSCLFFYFFWVVFLLEILTRQPEQNVFLAVFASQKLSEHSPPACNVFYLDKEYYHASTTTFEYILQFLNFEINTSIIKCSRIAEMFFSLIESGVCQNIRSFGSCDRLSVAFVFLRQKRENILFYSLSGYAILATHWSWTSVARKTLPRTGPPPP